MSSNTAKISDYKVFDSFKWQNKLPPLIQTTYSHWI